MRHKHGPYWFEETGPGVVEIENTSGTKFKVMITALESFVAARLRAELLTEITRELETAEPRDILRRRWRVRP